MWPVEDITWAWSHIPCHATRKLTCNNQGLIFLLFAVQIILNFMQMRKCHLHKCQTSLGQVHKLVTHPSKISLHNLLAPFNNPLGIHRKWCGGPWEENLCWVFFLAKQLMIFFGGEGSNFFPLLPEPLPQIINGSSLRPLPQPISHLQQLILVCWEIEKLGSFVSSRRSLMPPIIAPGAKINQWFLGFL